MQGFELIWQVAVQFSRIMPVCKEMDRLYALITLYIVCKDLKH